MAPKPSFLTELVKKTAAKQPKKEKVVRYNHPEQEPREDEVRGVMRQVA